MILYIIENVDENVIIYNCSLLVDILDWLKKFDFDLNSTESQEVSLYEQKIKLYNKTLFIIKHKNLSNNINPQISNGLMHIINKNNNISEEDMHKMEMQQAVFYYKRDFLIITKSPFQTINFTI